MTFGIDYQAAVPPERSGIGTYIYNLVGALAGLDHENDYTLVVASHEKNMRTVGENFHYLGKRNPLRLIKPFDSFHGPDFKLMRVIAGRKVVTIHDLASWVDGDFMSADFRELTRKKIEKSVRGADVIVTVSKTIKNQLEEYYPDVRGRVRVVYHGVSDEIGQSTPGTGDLDILKRYNITTPYLLFVGNIETRKNIITLLKAFRLFVEKEKTAHQLVLIGKPGWGSENIMEHSGHSLGPDRVRFIGWVSSQDISAFYRTADLFVYPSWYEGFGFPLLEAMKCRVPVVASDIPTHREIAGDSALYSQPSDAEGFARIFSLLLSDAALRAQLIAAGRSRSLLFSWEKTAQAMLDIYKG